MCVQIQSGCWLASRIVETWTKDTRKVFFRWEWKLALKCGYTSFRWGEIKAKCNICVKDVRTNLMRKYWFKSPVKWEIKVMCSNYNAFLLSKLALKHPVSKYQNRGIEIGTVSNDFEWQLALVFTLLRYKKKDNFVCRQSGPMVPSAGP